MSESSSPPNKEALEAGKMRLYSYYKPDLPAGDYNILVDHTLSSSGDLDIPLNSKKRFRVVTPRFSLPPGTVHSSYPHQGHGELAKVLPHLVLTDVHLPWEREVEEPAPDSSSDQKKEPPARTPWLGVLTFQVDELLAIQLPPSLQSVKQALDMSYKISLGTLRGMNETVAIPFSNQDITKPDKDRPAGEKSIDSVSIIMLKPELFQDLFTRQDQAGRNRQVSLERYKYLSHVRIVNSSGLARAGGDVTNPGADKEFSVVVSPRSGPTHILSKDPEAQHKPIPMVSHLVSLEGIKEHIKLPLPTQKKSIAIPTLYSWAYQSLPPDHIDYDYLMGQLVSQSQPYTLSDNFIKSMTKAILEAPITSNDEETKQEEKDARRFQAEWLKKRLEAGYSFTRYRPATGEETSALYRGPLIPLPNKPASLNNNASNDGSDLQIIDRSSGLPDLSYNLAWELGYALASSDREFTAAIMRLRASILSQASAAYHEKDLTATGTTSRQFKHKGAAIDALKEHTEPDGHFAKPKHHASMHKRWYKHHFTQSSSTGSVDYFAMRDEIEIAASSIIMGPPIDTPKESNPANNAQTPGKPADPVAATKGKVSDWSVISKWCLDKLMLQNIPAVYMYGEERILPSEALRTFYVDEAWLDVLLDGALSVANHSVYTESDDVRTELKKHLNSDTLKSQTAPVQIPSWGFLLRSKVVEAFPDLLIEASWEGPATSRLQVARMEHLAADTLICLFDRKPENGLFTAEGITLKQPPHQQHFSVGDDLDDNELSMSYKLISTTGKEIEASKKGTSQITWQRADQEGKPVREDLVKNRPGKIYDWDSQCLVFPDFAQSCWSVPNQILGPEVFNIKEPTSSMTGVQLNDEPLAIRLTFPKHVRKEYPYRQLPLPRRRERPPAQTPASSKTVLFARQPPIYFPFPKARLLPPPLPPTLQPATIYKSVFADIPSNIPPGGTTPIPSFKRLVPLANIKDSYLTKAVSPLLLLSRNIPTLSRGPIDLVFAITAPLALATFDPELILLSLTLYIPAGGDPADLLRTTVASPSILTILPSARGIAKGRRWLVTLQETHNKAVLGKFKRQVASGERQRLPTACLVASLRPRGKPHRMLVDGPDLSFLMESAEVNGVPGRGSIIFKEDYARTGDAGEQGREEDERKVNKAGTVEGLWEFEKERGRLG
ncbi:hypothetical protein MMC18_008550 [Xylographa bjoerkii]|nr:hypothetical protein [Xylographa bjoerkii]